MEIFKVESNIANLINEFNVSSFNSVSSILSWFNKAINYKGIFESEFGRSLVSSLKKLGYSGLTSPHEELEHYKKLMHTSTTENAESIGYTLISLIIKSIEDNNSLSPYLEQLIAIYNQNYNKEKTFNDMMDSLTASIGNYVVFVIIRDGSVKLLSGTLNGIVPYQRVVIDGIEYPFIGFNIEINKITSNDGKVLYSNILSSPKDDLIDYSVIEKMNNKLFGEKYKDKTKLL